MSIGSGGALFRTVVHFESCRHLAFRFAREEGIMESFGKQLPCCDVGGGKTPAARRSGRDRSCSGPDYVDYHDRPTLPVAGHALRQAINHYRPSHNPSFPLLSFLGTAGASLLMTPAEPGWPLWNADEDCPSRTRPSAGHADRSPHAATLPTGRCTAGRQARNDTATQTVCGYLAPRRSPYQSQIP